MKNFHLFSAFITMLLLGTQAHAQAPVYITAGQSNADGREYVSKLPSYMKNGYKHLKYTNVTSSSDGTFGSRTFEDLSGRYSFCDVAHYFIDQTRDADFYGIKCAYGGTAIDTLATYSTLPVWCADSTWIAANNAYRGDINQGKSLTKSLTEGLADCINTTLSKLEGGYDVKAIMWHQGESDRSRSGNYYKNFKDMINYMRDAVYALTGKEKDKTLPFIFGTVSHSSKQYSDAVEKAQKQVAAELPNVYYIDMSDAGLRSDALHFDSVWTEYLGKKMYNQLVELKLVDGEPLEVVKPHIPSASDTLQVEAERTWDFTAAWGAASADSLTNDELWPAYQKLGYRYSNPMSANQELATKSGYIFPETKGLYFKCGSGNRIIINPGKSLCFYGDNLYLTIPKVSPGQTVTITTASAKGDRGITTDNEEDVELICGGVKSSSKTTNTWKVKETLTEPVDLVFHSVGGAIYVYDIEVVSPYVQILVGADQKVAFSSTKACEVKSHEDLIKAYVPVSYDPSNEAIVLEQVDTIPANTGVVIIGEESLVGAKEVTTMKTYPNNLLVAVTADTIVEPTETVDDVTSFNFILKPENGSVDFHKLTASETLTAGTAYLRLPQATAGDVEVIKTALASDAATGIAMVNTVISQGTKGQWYTINGVAVERPGKGLYIRDGVKYLFK